MYRNSHHPEEVPEGVKEASDFLGRWREPVPDPAAKARLLRVLLAEMPDRELPRRLHWAGLILRSQARLVDRAAWAASGLVIALGALVTLFWYQPGSSAALPLVLVAPLVAACGVAFLYGKEADPALEVTLATPVSPRLILLARLALLFGFNLAVTLACSVWLALAQTDLTVMPLVTAWLAPMTFLSALAFLLSVLFFDSLASVLVSILLWFAMTVNNFVRFETVPLPDLLRSEFHLPMVIAAVALATAALWLAEREERWQGGVH